MCSQKDKMTGSIRPCEHSTAKPSAVKSIRANKLKFTKRWSALVLSLDANRQFFKSCVRLPRPIGALRQTPLSRFDYRHAVFIKPLVVEMHRDSIPKSRNNPAIARTDVIPPCPAFLLVSNQIVRFILCNRQRYEPERAMTVSSSDLRQIRVATEIARSMIARINSNA